MGMHMYIHMQNAVKTAINTPKLELGSKTANSFPSSSMGMHMYIHMQNTVKTAINTPKLELGSESRKSLKAKPKIQL